MRKNFQLGTGGRTFSQLRALAELDLPRAAHLLKRDKKQHSGKPRTCGLRFPPRLKLLR